MFRSVWDPVGDPVLWLGDFADEEDLLGRSLWGHRGMEGPSTTLILLPELSERRRRGRRGHRHTRRAAEESHEPEAAAGGEEEEGEPMQTSGDEREQDEERRRLLSTDFFADLPLGARQFETTMPADLQPPQKITDGYSYFTYAYSSCATLDDNNRPVESTRRRYEDSAGALKALRRCQMGSRTMVTTWRKENEQDEGQHTQQVSSGNVDEFEKEWKETTPFGAMEAQAQSGTTPSMVKSTEEGELVDEPLPQEIP